METTNFSSLVVLCVVRCENINHVLSSNIGSEIGPELG